jgi:hypothetical protein
MPSMPSRVCSLPHPLEGSDELTLACRVRYLETTK